MTTATPNKMNLKNEVLSRYHTDAKSGLGFEAIRMIKISGQPYEVSKIIDYVKSTFNVYKDTTYKYGEHEIHIWTSEDGRHTHLTLNTQRNLQDRNYEITDAIRNELETTFNDYAVTAVFGKGYQLSKEKIEEFILNYEANLDNLQLEKFNVIRINYVGFPKLSNEALIMYHEINRKVLTQLIGKRVIVNKVKGKFKALPDGEIGFFKLRTRSQYLPYQLHNINTLDFY
ncbi:hypothetical protein QTG56_24435 (plasmid) [Rossellomorea sp. AcN35-11]|nr:hypothetical protein [Rossellomorea aquimaris]WJV31783.1 hypothetical protein QTG56_24435 [Rossellomorea sp. AcN35-11]